MSVKKLAFLFLIYDEINNEDVWHSFFEHADPIVALRVIFR